MDCYGITDQVLLVLGILVVAVCFIFLISAWVGFGVVKITRTEIVGTVVCLALIALVLIYSGLHGHTHRFGDGKWHVIQICDQCEHEEPSHYYICPECGNWDDNAFTFRTRRARYDGWKFVGYEYGALGQLTKD